MLPASIKDSMKVCRRLGYRYMWIDRLCIRQDDDDHKKEQLGQMARIYSQADLVLIIASTDTVDDSIPGISIPRLEQIQARIDGLYLRYSYGDPEITMRRSAWFSRAWTFQELILAKRRVFITEKLAYMQCGEWFQLENDAKDSRRQRYTQPPDFKYRIMDSESDIMAASLIHKGDLSPNTATGYDQKQYFDNIRLTYSRRSLTNPRDIVNAISGVLDFIYGRSGHLFATPKTDFDRSLLWTNLPSNGNGTARARSVDPETAPPWSWTSCEGSIVSEPGSYMDFFGTLLCWFERSTPDYDSRHRQARRIRADGHPGVDRWEPVDSRDIARLADSRSNETIWPRLEKESRLDRIGSCVGIRCNP
ncbi:heterokaryon incompatibility protein-domain-containing protein [Hypoxylon crocopeplum]|nr:heterokaryon incompatibility protein-domain-containing protein [Hypoxylon crocopeplum]